MCFFFRAIDNSSPCFTKWSLTCFKEFLDVIVKIQYLVVVFYVVIGLFWLLW